jgi:hypothetical protein
MDKATGFIKNPLGIIGLFIALIYGTAVVVSGASPHLTDDQRWVLIIFAALFPEVVLFTFYKLVTEHHSKLYAPSDWKDERNVFGPQSAQVTLAREDEEVRQIIADEAAQLLVPAPTEIENKSISPGAPVQEVPVDYRSLVRDAEALAFRRLTELFPGKIYRNVTVEGAARNVPFDGLLIDAANKATLFEVKLVRHRRGLRNVLERVSESVALAASAVHNSPKSVTFVFVLVLVTQGVSPDQQKYMADTALRRLSEVNGVQPIVHVFDLEELRRAYGIGEPAL